MYQCENCGKKAHRDGMRDVSDSYQRFEPGDIWTDAECPDCGALAYPVVDLKDAPEDMPDDYVEDNQDHDGLARLKRILEQFLGEWDSDTDTDSDTDDDREERERYEQVQAAYDRLHPLILSADKVLWYLKKTCRHLYETCHTVSDRADWSLLEEVEDTIKEAEGGKP